MAEDKIATQPKGGFLANRPSFIKDGDVRGTESIGINDIKPPSLRIAQSTSPEVKRAEPAKYIAGLREGEFFNSTTREIYGEGPVGLVVVKTLGHRNVEFAPGDTSTVLDFNVPDGDPRTQFTNEVRDGKTVRVKPRATLFYDYFVLAVLEDGRRVLMQMSLKSTQLKKAKDLNTLLSGAKMPSFAFLFAATPVPEKRGNNNFYGWRIDPKGYVPEDVYNEASKYFDDFADKTIVLESTVDDDGDGTIAPHSSDIPF